MSEAYSGLFIRSNFHDTSYIPAPDHFWTSPDIIPLGENTLSYERAIHTYGGPDIGQPVISNLNNNVYVRCLNLAQKSMKGYVNLYYAEDSLFLLPASWKPVKLPAVNNQFVNGQENPNIQSGEIALVRVPFMLSQLAAGKHWCFIAVANNNDIPFGIPQSFSSNAAYALWVRDHPNVAQRNIGYSGSATGKVTLYVTFGNANAIPSKFTFVMSGANLPVNTQWSARCSDPRLGGEYNQYGTFSSAGTAATQLTVPPHVGGQDSPLMTMAFTFSTPNGAAFPGNSSVNITYYQQATLAAESRDLFEAEREAVHHYRVPSVGDAARFELSELIKVGATTEFLGYGGN
jgi:hypothetical protein